MLNFVLGRAGSGKTETLRRRLVELCRAGREGLFLIVPEQYSFAAERAVLELAGPKLAQGVQVFSFTRLAEAVFRREGGAAGKRLSDGGRRVLMALAIAACEDQLTVYKSAAKNDRVTDIMLTAVNEMKMCGISPETLRETAEKLPGEGFKGKVREIALLYGAYEALVEASYLDSRDDLSRLKEALRGSRFFEGATVMVDSFDGFTAQEMGVLREILKKAESVTVALCTDGQAQGESGLFALVERTRRRLCRAAEEEGVPLGETTLLTHAPRYNNENLRLLEAQLFCADAPMTAEDHRGIEIFSARDVYEEAEFTAAAIRRLTRREGYRYRDIAVICRSAEPYYGCLSAAFKKRDIPCFVSAPAPVDGEPLPRLLLGAFAAAGSGFATEDLLELMKTGLAGFGEEEICDLENYAYLWRLSGAAWREPFTRHPRGFGEEETEEDREYLRYLNGLRARLMGPLIRFAQKTRDASGAEIAEAAYNLLEDLHAPENLTAYCRTLKEAGEEALAQKQVRVWDLVMGLLDQFHSILGDRKTARERFARLFREVLAKEDVSEIPQTTDEVIFGTVEQVRQTSPRAAFLLGAAQGDFPMTPRPSGVFSDVERRTLIGLDLPLGDPMEQRAMEERYLAYSAACISSELLILSWPRSSAGEDKEPGELISGVRAAFPTLTPLKDLPDEFYANSREAAFSRMAMRLSENSPRARALEKVFLGDEAYAGRMEALRRAAGNTPLRLRDPALIRKLYGESPFLSPTQIETYHTCPFRYFCRYGLNARERRRAEVDVMQYGTLMHYLFERIFRIPREERLALSAEQLLDAVTALIRAYADENLGGFHQLSGEEKYRLDRMARSAAIVIRHVEEELSQSRFEPRYFELGLRHGAAFPPLRIETGDGRTVTVGGTIDRADTVTLPDGREYIRVVDYKTGKKKFKLIDVLYGLNMQMLVYLAALTENGQRFPAGIFYVPAAEPSFTAERGAAAEEVAREAQRELRMNGLVLSDSEIIEAMEQGARGRFIPASLNRDGTVSRTGSTLSDEELRTVMHYCKRLIATMGRALKQGDAEARPCMVNRNACKFCPYRTVCGKELMDRDILQDNAGNAQVLARMRKGREG